MPKVAASLSDVSTDVSPAPADTYELVIEDVKETVKVEGGNRRVQYDFQNKIFAPGSPNHDKMVFDTCAMHKNDGQLNKMGMAKLKRYFEATHGMEWTAANADDLDTDTLKDQHFLAEVYIESYSDPKRPGAPPRMSNRINETSIREAK